MSTILAILVAVASASDYDFSRSFSRPAVSARSSPSSPSSRSSSYSSLDSYSSSRKFAWRYYLSLCLDRICSRHEENHVYAHTCIFFVLIRSIGEREREEKKNRTVDWDLNLNLLFFLAMMPKSTPRRSATATCFRSDFPGMMSCLLLICSTISFSVKPSSGCSVLSRSYTRIDFRTISIFFPRLVRELAGKERRGGRQGDTSLSRRSPEVGLASMRLFQRSFVPGARLSSRWLIFLPSFPLSSFPSSIFGYSLFSFSSNHHLFRFFSFLEHVDAN